MARLISSGFESQSLGSGAEDVGFLVVGGAVETTVVRSGKASFKVDTTANYADWQNIGTTLGRDYYWRFYLRFPTAPSANAVVARLYSDAGTTTICSVRLSTGRLIALLNAAGSNVQGASSPALAVDTWHRIEVRVNVPTSGNGTLDLRVNGTTVGSVATTGVGNIAPHTWRHGYISGTVPSLYFDDVALNDDQGSDQNSWPGEGKIVLLRPTSDGTRNNWTNGALGTTNLYDALDNTPPVGEATTGLTATAQIEHLVPAATDTYTAILGAYTTALASGGGGLASTDIVTLIQAVAIGGDSNAAIAVTMGVKPSSNPAGTEGTSLTPVGAAGTYPTGWITRRSAISYSPSVTLSTSPQIELRKAVASADTLAFCFAGLYVEYVPWIAGTSAGTSTATGDLAVSHPLEGASTGVGADSGSLGVAFALAASVAGAGTAAADLAVAHPLDGTAAGAGTLTGDLTVAHPVEGTSTGAGTASGDLTVDRPLAGTSAGASDASASLSVAYTLVGSSAGAGTASAAIGVAYTLAGSSAGAGTATGDMAAGIVLAGSAAGAGTASGAITYAAALGGSSTGAGTAAGNVVVDRPLAGSSAGAGNVSGSLGLALILAGTSTGAGTATAGLLIGRPLAGVSAGTSTASGGLSVTLGLAGSSTGVGAAIASLRGAWALVGSAAGAGTVTGSLGMFSGTGKGPGPDTPRFGFGEPDTPRSPFRQPETARF